MHILLMVILAWKWQRPNLLLCLCVGKELAESIIEAADGLGLNMDMCHGQAYDGASNMAGAINGCAKLIRDKYPKAVYQHCRSHCLNLAILKTTSTIPQISMII